MDELPRYKCHKVVSAAPIVSFNLPAHSISVQLPDGKRATIIPAEQFWRRNKVEPGGRGYYVRYADGFESYSPSAVFEDGYSPVGD